MPHPKQKQSYARTHKRRAHQALQPQSLVVCSHCGASVPAHRVCTTCGYYRERNVLRLDEKRTRKEERALRRQAKQQQEEQETEEDKEKSPTADVKARV